MATNKTIQRLSLSDSLKKRVFDLFFAVLGIGLFWWLIIIAAFLAWRNTGENGFFAQDRVGQFGENFKVIKIRTMKSASGQNTTVTTSNDPRITSLGKFFRKTKVDELPQLFNVLLGQMSFVGPRPDVSGFADLLEGEDKIILSLKPGITGPATLAYRNEEELLASVENPEEYNKNVIFPDKVRLNKEYLSNYTLFTDIKYIFATIL